MFFSLFNSFAAVKAAPNIVCIQDPHVWPSQLPSFHNFRFFHAPCSDGFKACVAFHVPTMLFSYVIAPSSFSDRFDVAAWDIYGFDLFGASVTQFRIVNVYNLNFRHIGSMTLSPLVSSPEVHFPWLVVGDCNIHHLLSEPLRAPFSEELSLSFPYFSRASELSYLLLNLPGVFTRFPLGGNSRPSVIDLAFASPGLAPCCHHCDTTLLSTGSDQVPITIIASILACFHRRLRLIGPLLTGTPSLPFWAIWFSRRPTTSNLTLPRSLVQQPSLYFHLPPHLSHLSQKALPQI